MNPKSLLQQMLKIKSVSTIDVPKKTSVSKQIPFPNPVQIIKPRYMGSTPQSRALDSA